MEIVGDLITWHGLPFQASHSLAYAMHSFCKFTTHNLLICVSLVLGFFYVFSVPVDISITQASSTYLVNAVIWPRQHAIDKHCLHESLTSIQESSPLHRITAFYGTLFREMWMAIRLCYFDSRYLVSDS